MNVCKDCNTTESKSWYCNKTQCKKCYARQRYLSNKSEILSEKKLYYQENRDAKLLYRKKNNHKINQQYKQRYRNDLEFKLRVSMRTRLWHAIKDHAKSGSAIDDLGCTVDQLKTHIESQFEPGMTWENWSHEGWHIDHIIPLYKFNLEDEEQFKQACHFSNLRPLWKDDNYRNR